MSIKFSSHKIPAVAIALTVAFCVLAACGSSHDIVGKWRMAGDSNAIVWEFFNNGSVQIGDSKGRYRLDRDRLKIEQGFATSVYQMEFLGDRLILRDTHNSKLEFTRIK
jgi:hypothetical protein